MFEKNQMVYLESFQWRNAEISLGQKERNGAKKKRDRKKKMGKAETAKIGNKHNTQLTQYGKCLA